MSKIKRDGVRREKVYKTKDGYKAVIELSWNKELSWSNNKLLSIFLLFVLISMYNSAKKVNATLKI